MLIDPVDGSEGAAAGVVVDVDEGTALEAEEASAGDAVALEQDGGGVLVGVDVVCGGGVVDAVEVGQGEVGGGDGVCEDDVYLAAELVEDLGESQGGADGVAVGACAKCSTPRSSIACACCRAVSRCTLPEHF